MGGGWWEMGGSAGNGLYLVRMDGCWPKTDGSGEKNSVWKSSHETGKKPLTRLDFN